MSPRSKREYIDAIFLRYKKAPHKEKTIILDEFCATKKTQFPLKISPYFYCHFLVFGLAEKVLKKRVTLHMLRHSSATYWAPKMNRYQLCARYGWAFSSDMPDRYIERKGIIFEQIAEKGDGDQTTKLQKENRKLTEKIETLEREHNKRRKALEFIMPMIEEIDQDILKRKAFQKRREQILGDQEYIGNTEAQ